MLAPRLPSRATAILTPAAASLTALLLYLSTLSPTVFWSDSAEFQRLAYTLEPSHPPGYPLYTLLAHLWISLWPSLEVARAVNLLSAVTAAAAVGVSSWAVWQLTRRPLAAVASGLALGTAPSFWSQSIVAEVYALHALLAASLLASVIASRRLHLPAIALVAGLSLAHHRLALLLLPGTALALFLRRGDTDLSPGRLAASLGALGLGPATYLLTWWRGDWNGAQFWAYVTHGGSTWIATTELTSYVLHTVRPLLLQQLGVLGLLAAAFGLVWAARSGDRLRAAAAGLSVSWFAGASFLAVYRVPDAFAFLTHLQVIQALALGLGVAGAARGAERLSPGPRRTLSLALLLGVGMVLLAQAHGAWAAVRRTPAEWLYPRQRSLAVLERVSGDGVLVADWLLGQTMRYLQQVEDVRSDVRILIPPQKDPAIPLGLLETGRPVYLWGTAWRQQFAPASHGQASFQLVRAEHEPNREGLFRLTAGWTRRSRRSWRVEQGRPALRLETVSVQPWPLRADEPVRLQLCWSGNTQVLAARDVVIELDPAHRWLSHTVSGQSVSGGLPCATYYLMLPPAPFAPLLEARLKLVDRTAAGADWTIDLGSWPVEPSAPAGWAQRFTFPPMATPGLPAAVTADGVRLLAVAYEPETRPGIGLPLTAYWWVPGGAGADQMVHWELVGAGGTVEQVSSIAPAWNSWEGGRLVASRVTLQPPRRLAPGTYRLTLSSRRAPPVPLGEVHVRDWPRQWQAPPVQHSTDVRLADDIVRLVGYDLVAGGSAVTVTLVWQAQQPPSGSWKVFVHLVDGEQLVAQHDAVPGGGWRWTDGWQAGEYVLDTHPLDLPPDLPAGEYGLLVGMYDPVTGARLPLRVAGVGKAQMAYPLTVIRLPPRGPGSGADRP